MGWHSLEPASKLREGEVKTFRMGGRYLAIGRTADGYFAMDDLCPHAGGSLGEGMLDDECVLCPIHGYAYHVRTGEGLDDGNEVQVYQVELQGDLLRVNLHDEE
ncbi:MAG: Rieske (2Fe-2S) protein [Deltaproteobacteria bacterium]|nr:Rieske (2Fe-2S) protein [Deltaproteobacteria bacterium]MBW2393626.1 Rieske (2Fe-2S) protein [Deltaproteobacteria bacterium]